MGFVLFLIVIVLVWLIARGNGSKLADQALQEVAQLRALLADQQKRFDEMQKKRAERQAEMKEFKDWKAQQAPKAQ